MHTRLIRTFVIAACMVSFATLVRAQSTANSPLGYPVCALPGSQILQQVIGFPWIPFALWEDMRDSTLNHVDLYVSRLVDRGASPPSGSPVATGPAYQWHAREAMTGNWAIDPPVQPRGVLVAWQQDLGLTHEVRARRVIDAGGSTWPDSGVVLTENEPDASTVRVIGDAHGGGIVAWIDRRLGPPHIYAQRLNEAGAPLWAADGQKMVIAGGYEVSFELTSRGIDGAYLTWINVTVGEGFSRIDLRALALGADGTPDPAWPSDGVILAGPWINQSHVTHHAAFESQGLVVAWGEKASSPDTGVVRIQYLTDSGARVSGWPAGGQILVSGAPGAAGSFLASVGGGLLISSWADERHQNGTNPLVTDVYAQRMRLSSTVGPDWSLGGVAVKLNDDIKQPTSLFVNPYSNMLFFWDDQAGPVVPFAQTLRPDGLVFPGWPADGVQLCSAPGAQSGALACSDGLAGAYFAWTDQRDYATLGEDIYQNSINGAGVLEVPILSEPGLDLSAAQPNPTRNAIHFSLSLPGPGLVNAAIFDIAGRRERILESSMRPAGSMTLSWDGRDDSGRRAAPGIHFLRVRAGARSLVRRFVVLR